MLTADRVVIKKEIFRLRRLMRHEGDAGQMATAIRELRAHAKKCVNRKSKRIQNRPRPTYPEDLPITTKGNDIIESIRANQVVIISGETGSGKTTQIPKLCLAAGRGIDGKIACTQPRRIAAISVSQRIAEELGEPLGRSVGYKIRFKEKGGQNVYIKIMTDGMLLAETQHDRYLNEYDTIIIDEAHERSLNIDFSLGIIKTLLAKRIDLKLIITSATIDTDKFSKAFNGAPVIEVSGRMYPVDTRYEFPENGFDEISDATHVEWAVTVLDRLHKKNPYGDVLVFMPTEQDIRETCDLIEGRKHDGLVVMPLFARMPANLQKRVFSSVPARKVVVATNIAETSLTIPGIKYVIDTGLARISQYLPRTRTTSLPVVPVSKSSADQRQGRCGRVENGVCIRLYPESDYNNRPQFTQPEILRSNLAEVILRMIALKLGDISVFPFIDNPAEKSIRDGFNLLLELGAITTPARSNRKKQGTRRGEEKTGPRFVLTSYGQLMAKIPLDPRLSRIIIEARQQECLNEIMIITAALSIMDPRERPPEKQAEADRAHAGFSDANSDFISLLNIWNDYHNSRSGKMGLGHLKKYCKSNFLSFNRMREWRDIHHQIQVLLKEHDIIDNSAKQARTSIEPFSETYVAVHKSILSGFLSNIAMRAEKPYFKGAMGKEIMIFPGSGLFKSPGKWVVAAEIVETSRVFARGVANIDNRWIEPFARNQCKYTYLNPHWEKNRGEVRATKQVSLYGLLIDSGTTVSFGKINPEEATGIFIQSALIQQDVKKPAPFMVHNRRLIEEIGSLEDRIRRRDLLVDEYNLVRFYEQRLEGIYSIDTLMKHIKNRGSDDFLRMRKEDLQLYTPAHDELNQYPDKVRVGEQEYMVSYRFDPGREDDGVTIGIPADAAASVATEELDWIVPGLFGEKITEMLKGLPKQFRKKLVPISTSVDIIVAEMPSKKTRLKTQLSQFIHGRFGVDIPATAWPEEQLSDHLKMRIALTDPKGDIIRAGRDKSILKTAEGLDDIGAEFKNACAKRERRITSDWDIGDLPDSIQLTGRRGGKWVVYPGLSVEDKEIWLRLSQNRAKANISHVKGVAALLSRYFSKDLKYLKKDLIVPVLSIETVAFFGGPKVFEKYLFQRIAGELFEKNIRTAEQYATYRDTLSHAIIHRKGKEKIDLVVPLLKVYRATRDTLHDLEKTHPSNPGVLDIVRSIREELTKLMPENFVLLYPNSRLEKMDRYLKSMSIRAQRGAVNPEKDQVRREQITPFTEQLSEMIKGLSPNTSPEKRSAIEGLFWMIEEYKISVFAQEIKTDGPISKKRLSKRIREMERMI